MRRISEVTEHQTTTVQRPLAVMTMFRVQTMYISRTALSWWKLWRRPVCCTRYKSTQTTIIT